MVEEGPQKMAREAPPAGSADTVLGMVDRLYRGCALLRVHASEADREQLAQAALEMETLSLMLRGAILRREAAEMGRAA